MKCVRKWLAVVGACALVSTALCGMSGGLLTNAEAEWQDVPGGNFLTGCTVSGDVGKIIADTAAGTFTSGQEGGTIYLDLSASVSPAEGALLAYDIEVVRGGAYLNPETSSGWTVGDTFVQAINDAHSTGGGPSSLGVGRYIGTADLSAVWPTSTGTSQVMLKLDPDSQIRIRTLKFVRLKTELVDIAGGDLLAAYKAAGDLDKIDADTATNTFTSGAQGGTLYLDLYKAGSEERAQIAPSEGALLYYDFTVAMVDHDLGDENHAYHGKARIEPNPWGTDSAAIADAFMNGVAANKGINLFEGKLPVGDYQGTLDVSAVWKSDNGTDCIALLLNEYTEISIRDLKFVKVQTLLKPNDVPNGNLLADYVPVVNEEQAVCDKTTGTLTNQHTGQVDIILDLYDGNGSRASIKPAAGSVLAYDITVNTGSAYILPDAWTAEGGYNYSVGDAFIQAVNDAHSTGGGPSSLGEGHYTGTVDLSAVWPEDKGAASVMVRLPAGSSVTIKTLKFVVLAPTADTEDVPGGDLLASYAAAGDEVGKIIVDQTGRVFTSGEGYGSAVLTPGQSITPPDGAKLYYDFTIEMAEHTPDDANHSYHGRCAFKIDVASEADALSNALMNGIAKDNGKEVWEGTLPAGEYQGVLDLSAVWGTDAAAAALSLRLNEFTRVTLGSWKLVSGGSLEEDEIVDRENGDLNAGYTVSGVTDTDLDKVDIDAEAGSFVTAGENVQLYLNLTSDGKTHCVYPAANEKLYYEITVSEVEHDAESESPDVHPYHGKMYISPILRGDESPYTVGNAWTAIMVQKQGSGLYDSYLPAAVYKGYADLSTVWSVEQGCAQILLKINAYTRVEIKALRFAIEEESGGKDDTGGTMTDGNITYAYRKSIDLGMTDMYDALGVNEPVKAEGQTTYIRSGEAGAWISEAYYDQLLDFSGFEAYLAYDFTVAEGGVNLSQNFADSTVNIAALIAKKHQVTLIDEDKLPAGTYTGVVKPADWPAGEATLKTLAAWSTPGSAFTVRSLRLIDVTDVTDNGTGGEPAPEKETLVNLLPESLEKWSKEFENRNAVIEGDLLSGWKLSVPENATDASARGYFGYTEIGENSLLLCYDFIIENGEAGIHLRAGVRQEGDKEVARTYLNGKDSLTLTPYIAAVAGVKPIADPVYGEDRLPAGHYQGVICLDDAIPAAFKTEGYSWWDCGIVGQDATVTFRELAFAKNVSASEIKTDGSPHTGASGSAVPVLAVAAASGAVIWSCRRCKAKKMRIKAKV